VNNEKICIKCGQSKPLTTEFFNTNKANKDGFVGECKICRKIYSKERREENKEYFSQYKKQYSINNKEKIRESNRRYVNENRDKIREYQRKNYQSNRDRINERKRERYKNNKDKSRNYYLANKDRYIAQHRKYRNENKELIARNNKDYKIKNKDKFSEWSKKWRKNNPERVKVAKQRRRTREKLVIATLTPEQWENIKEIFSHRCAYCGKEKPLTQEHFIALSKGGEFTHNNVLPVCRSCNSSKRDSDFFTWYPNKAFYCKKREKTLLKFLGYQNCKVQQLTLY